MYLPKAKEIIDLNIKEAGKKMPPDVKEALIMMSNIAQNILNYREGKAVDFTLPLPGETFAPDPQ